MKLPPRHRRLETYYYRREDNYNIGERIIVIDRNIIFPDEHPKHQQPYNFQHDYSEVYYCYSDGKVNTRILFKRDNSKPAVDEIFLKLTLFQRTKLNILNHTTWFHTNRVAAWTLVGSIILGILNIGILTYNSVTIPRQYQLLIDERDKSILDQKEIISTLQDEIERLKVPPMPDTVLNAASLPQ
jgi:hypothetical protein